MKRAERRGKSIIALMLLALTLSNLTGCAAPAGEGDPTGESIVETAPPETMPPPTAPADGDPDTLSCQGSYTVSGDGLTESRDNVVATAGDARLTNAQLQVYYWLEVAAYLREHPDVSFDQGLDTLMYDPELTWQQYFLGQALNAWHRHAALVEMGTAEGTPTEEAYQPIEAYHEANLNEDMPALQYLYGYTNASYVPNSLHQAYLDDLPGLLEEMAQAAGYESGEAMAADLTGGDLSSLTGWAELYNRAYMYFAECTYYMEPTEEEVEEYRNLHPGDYDMDGLLVDFRHILVIPENAALAADGTVDALPDDWENAYDEAYALYVKTQYKSFAEDTFAEMANASSDDEGSRLNGGLYSGIRQGQLVEELDSWLFDPQRRAGDRAVIRTACGYHLVYFSGSTTEGLAAAREDLITGLCEELMTHALESYPMTVDYSAIALGLAHQTGPEVDMEQVLYPDIAHERYPTAPLYFQQDYPHTYYGKYPIANWGCGITTMAMLSSYMTDEQWTPPELCAIYGYYCAEKGTNIVMYDNVPAEMGFYLEKRTWDWNEVVAALENGQVVACLQYAGYWTKGGHFLLLQRVTEDGLIEVRDSNLFNFGTLSGHQINAHEPDVITPKGAYYWIYQKKITRIPACCRCDDTGHENVAMAMFTGDYCCPKCRTALHRREIFQSLCCSKVGA